MVIVAYPRKTPKFWIALLGVLLSLTERVSQKLCVWNSREVKKPRAVYSFDQRGLGLRPLDWSKSPPEEWWKDESLESVLRRLRKDWGKFYRFKLKG